mgnify:CR=1 FL=1
MAEIITRDSEEFKELTGWIRRAGKAVEEATARMRPTIADEHYMTGDDVCALLHISRRTLQTLRDEKMVPYTTIGGKLLYPESGLYEVLKKNYRDFRRFRKSRQREETSSELWLGGRFFLLSCYMASLKT